MNAAPARPPPWPFARAIAGACWLAAVAGCASLPDARRAMAVAPAQEVTFESARGEVPDARGEAIVDYLERRTGAADLLNKHLAFEQTVNADSPLVLGNKLTLLQNGPQTYRAMFAAIEAATDHVNLETYIFGDDEVGQRFADLLVACQAAGVQVNIIYDSVGSLATPAAFFDRLKSAGIRVLEFNPVNPLAGRKAGWGLNNRDHRKLLVVDGKTAFVGGINISDTYSSSPSSSSSSGSSGSRSSDSTGKAEAAPNSGWRDTHIQIEGPVVADFQRLFLDTWKRQKGDPLPPRNYFPPHERVGDEIVRAIGSTPDDAQSLIYLTLISAITHAQLRVYLTIAYFAPDSQLLKALTDAARRGVEVKLVLPSYTDSSAIFHLGRSHYTKLLRSGVEIYERRGAVMHAKTACIDGVWSTIGSTNLDWRSFLHNDEINAVVLGGNFAAQMETMFSDDLAQSDQVTLSRWKRRPLSVRVKEWMARLGAYWL